MPAPDTIIGAKGAGWRSECSKCGALVLSDNLDSFGLPWGARVVQDAGRSPMNRKSAVRVLDIIARGVQYFKIGYGGYLTFVVGVSGTVSAVYYLAIVNTAWLHGIFPTIAVFVTVGLVIGVPLAIFLGWFDQNSSFRREQMRIDPFQRAQFELYVRLAEKEGWTDLREQINYLMGKKK